VIFVPGYGLTIPLSLHGIISQFDTVNPTWMDYDTYLHVVLMSDLAWHPSSSEYADKEEKLVASVTTCDEGVKLDDQVYFEVSNHDHHINAIQSLQESSETVEFHDDPGNLSNCLVSLSGYQDKVLHPLNDGSQKIMALLTAEKQSVLMPQVLATRWNIGLNTAMCTMNVMMQQGIHYVLVPSKWKL